MSSYLFENLSLECPYDISPFPEFIDFYDAKSQEKCFHCQYIHFETHFSQHTPCLLHTWNTYVWPRGEKASLYNNVGNVFDFSDKTDVFTYYMVIS